MSVIIFACLCCLTGLGYYAIDKWAEGLKGSRLGQFASVAEQIRQDVKRKLDEFVKTEQNRPYTDYQYYYVSDIPQQKAQSQQALTLMRSPLAGRVENSFALVNFQIDSSGNIVTPQDGLIQNEGYNDLNSDIDNTAKLMASNIKSNLLPVLENRMPGNNVSGPAAAYYSGGYGGYTSSGNLAITEASKGRSTEQIVGKVIPAERIDAKQISSQNIAGTRPGKKSEALEIESLKGQAQQPQVTVQTRSRIAENAMANTINTGFIDQNSQQIQSPERQTQQLLKNISQVGQKAVTQEIQGEKSEQRDEFQKAVPQRPETAPKSNQPQQEQESDMVQIRIEPFVPVVVGGEDSDKSIFGGQVFMLRHVQIEDRHLLQGFKLNESRLLAEIDESAKRFIKEGMSFELSKQEDPAASYWASLDFGFGEVVLNLKETIPGWINRSIGRLKGWYFGTITIVFIAVTLGMISLWRNARSQLKLAQKKDDFISAVSHELRTPLTSIRMFSEMLEKDWVKSEEKKREYYKGMQQESERLSRLIENVLDFSRIQKGKKKYSFTIGDINGCIAKVVEMIRPYAQQHNFTIKTEFGDLGQRSFDRDAVTQIVVNLLDNAVKYARDCEDRTITIRTASDPQFTIIEVEDHGPGVPHRQRKKIFEEFYRIGSEATRETQGTGLGLALVKKFAEAHNGFAEIVSAKPTGAIFRVCLARS